MAARCAVVLLCAYVLWHMQSTGGQLFYQPLLRGVEMTKPKCSAEAATRGLVQSKRGNVLVWYAAAVTREDGVRAANGRPEWYGCWPSDWDPREQ